MRIYEHDPSLCRKELDLMNLVRDAVPVPEVIHAEPEGRDDLPPFALFRWIDAVTFLAVKRSGDLDAIAQAGGTLPPDWRQLASIRKSFGSAAGRSARLDMLPSACLPAKSRLRQAEACPTETANSRLGQALAAPQGCMDYSG